jgi:hypothetical protein
MLFSASQRLCGGLLVFTASSSFASFVIQQGADFKPAATAHNATSFEI